MKYIQISIDFENEENGHKGQALFKVDCSDKKQTKKNAENALKYLKLIVDELRKEVKK